MKKRFYQLTTEGRTANIDIYGDITSWPWLDSDVSAYDIKQQINDLDVDDINVYINSYGGEVAEALAIYSALKRNRAKVHTYCDGFTCSAATIIFCAGATRTIGEIALMMIHNCMTYLGYANSGEMRKAAEDNDKINRSSIEAYKAVTGLEEDKIREMMDAETWLTAQEALDLGFATEIAKCDPDEDEGAKQSAFGFVRSAVLHNAPEPAEGIPLEAVIEDSETVKRIEEKLDKILEKMQSTGPAFFNPKKQEEEEPENFLSKLIKNL